MRKGSIIYTIFIFLFFINIACSGEPNIKFKEMSFDFGDVKQKEELNHVFLFENTGTGTLIIEKVKAG